MNWNDKNKKKKSTGRKMREPEKGSYRCNICPTVRELKGLSDNPTRCGNHYKHKNKVNRLDSEYFMQKKTKPVKVSKEIKREIRLYNRCGIVIY